MLGARKRTSVCVPAYVCVGGEGGKRLKERKKEKKRFVSFYPRLDVLAGSFEGYRNGDSCTSTSEKDLDYSGVYLSDC